MDWGVISGCSSLLGLILALVRLGEWKARQEVRLNNLEKHCETSDGKVDALAVLQSQQNLVLTEIKTRLEFLLDTDEKVIEQQNIEKSNQVKSIRNQYLSDTLARCDRYEKQKAIGHDTTESEDTYRNYLLYLQYLHDIPQSVNFPNEEVLTFDEWSVTLIEKINTSEES